MISPLPPSVDISQIDFPSRHYDVRSFQENPPKPLRAKGEVEFEDWAFEIGGMMKGEEEVAREAFRQEWRGLPYRREIGEDSPRSFLAVSYEFLNMALNADEAQRMVWHIEDQARTLARAVRNSSGWER